MRKILLLVFIYAAIYTQAQNVIHKELLGRPTDHSITVEMFFDSEVDVAVTYGPSPSNLLNQTNWQTVAAGDSAEIIINGLQADTKYFYAVIYKNKGASNYITRPTYSFNTQRKTGSGFTFVVQADPHLDASSDTALYRTCLQNQLDDKPDFMIDLGDFLMTDKLKNANKIVPKDTIPYRCKLLRSYYENITHSVPLFIALGNHEGEAKWNLNNTPNNIAIWGTQERKKYFLNPEPDQFYTGDTLDHTFIGKRENYYSWTWGDALFIVIDPYWYTGPKPDSLHGWGWTLGKVQYDWLKTTLENSKSPFKFVFSHQIIGGDPEGRGGVEFADRYEWGGKNIDGTEGFATNRPGWDKPIRQLLEENRVTIFFHGHDHFFGKQDKNCLVYQETPQPSLPNFQNSSAADYGYFQGQILPNAGHIKVSVDSNGVKVEYIRAYLPKNETPTRKNKDISATYYIGKINCYDSLSTGVPVIWNKNYADELVYPNPFEQETTIEFSVKSANRITLQIFDEQGHLVRNLFQTNLLNVGKYQVVWDGKDGNGNTLSAGIYWYKISENSIFKSSGKIILNK